MRRTILLCVVVLLALVFAAQPTGATPSTDVEIVVTSYWEDGFGTFTLSGGGLGGCESGTTADLGDSLTGHPGVVGNFHVRKVFTCADESGTFTLLIQAQTRDLITDEGRWTVLSGSGAYEKLHGTGDLLGIYIDEDGNPVEEPGTDAGIIDNLTGRMHID